MSNSNKIAVDRYTAKTGDTVPQNGKNFSAQPANSPHGQILSLQRTIGNRAVGRLFRSVRCFPETQDSRESSLHELKHPAQPVSKGTLLQRFVACKSPDRCPPRSPHELTRSASTPHQAEIYQPTTFGVLISNFAIDEHRVKPDLPGNPTWIALVTRIGSLPNEEWEILGFTDCQGSVSLNQTLRQDRASAVAALLPAAAVPKVTRAAAAAPGDCIADNSSESARSRNRSVIVRRLPGSPGPAAPPWLAGPVGPVRPAGAPADFCVPYTNRMEAWAARQFLETVWLNAALRQFGTEVHDLWRDYLNRPKGSGLAPRVFRGGGNPIVDAFRTDPETVRHQGLLYADITAATSRTPEAHVPFTGTYYISPQIPLGTLLPAASLNRIINYGDPAHRIPGNIAGGTGVIGTASSDAGPDLRLFTGNVRVERRRAGPGAPETGSALIEMQLQVIDAVDFCPGAPGGWVAQRFTIPMSRLEATPTEATYDLPFHVFVDLNGNVPIP